MGTTEISTVSNITLVTLQGSPATTGFMAEVFERIAELDINIDMISMPPNHGANAGLSFTISDQDLIEVLSFANTLKTETGIKVIVSSVNHKISVYDPQMKNTPHHDFRSRDLPPRHGSGLRHRFGSHRRSGQREIIFRQL